MKMWEPSRDRIEQSHAAAFIRQINDTSSESLKDFHQLYEYSIENPIQFWNHAFSFCDIIHEGSLDPCVLEGEHLLDTRWFPNVRLNYAENLLRADGEKMAIIFRGEEKFQKSLQYSDLYNAVRRVRSALKAQGVSKGDRVAGFLPNMPEALIAMLATSSLGAIWSSASPDFGVEGVLDRFGQIEPDVLFCANGYYYKGKTFDSLEKVREIQNGLATLKKTIVVPYVAMDEQQPLENSLCYEHIMHDAAFDEAMAYERVPFSHPLFIMFSSGTTGKPKCIVHSVGGTLLEHKKELLLHTNLKDEDTIFYATTCGWMMWNWLASALSCNATLFLYDGFPMAREGSILFDFVDEHNISIFGTSAGYLSAVSKQGLQPQTSHSLKTLHTILSTGSPLLPEQFDYVYQDIKEDVCLSSIAGGTDIIGCFALGCPMLPVYRGELQTRSLGYAVEVLNDEGKPIQGQKGELVCTLPFPSMPVAFWNDPEKKRYFDAYFAVYDNIWRHGDYVELTDHDGLIFYGRSDAVLNPGGVRIGTAEIYRQLEAIDEIQQGVVIGQQWQGDERIVLFVQLKEGVTLDESLEQKIKQEIREQATPRHVPKKIIAVADIPVTRSGKISELAIKKIIHGESVKNAEALKNPESLELFKDIAALQEG